MTKKQITLGLLIGFIITLIFVYSLVLNINKPFSLDYTDNLQINFILKHNMDSILSLNLSELPNLPIFYGFKNTLFYSNHFLLQSILALPIYLLTKNIVLTTNLFDLLTLFLSFSSMYIFSLYLSKRILPSLIAAIIFTFNPFIASHFPDALELFSLQWIPLAFLLFELFLDTKKPNYIFYFFIVISVQLVSSVYYFIFLTFTFTIYAAIRLWQKKISLLQFITLKSLLGLMLLIITAFLEFHFYSVTLNNATDQSIFERTILLHSPFIMNWFFVPNTNLLYSSIQSMALKIAPAFFSMGDNNTLSFFWGIVPLLLFVSSLKLIRYSLRNIWFIFLVLLSANFVLSFGPSINITQYARTINPPYMLLYHIYPFWKYIREPSRFAVFVFFFLALINSFVMKDLLKSNKSLILGCFILIFILIEYINVPFSFLEISPQTMNFYSNLKNNKRISAIVDLPIGMRIYTQTNSLRLEIHDSHYMFWQMFHGKKLLNGYSSYYPSDYLDRANLLLIDIPTKDKILKLKDWGVDAVILHKDEFEDIKEFSKQVKELKLLQIPKIAQTDNLVLYDLTRWQ